MCLFESVAVFLSARDAKLGGSFPWWWRGWGQGGGGVELTPSPIKESLRKPSGILRDIRLASSWTSKVRSPAKEGQFLEKTIDLFQVKNTFYRAEHLNPSLILMWLCAMRVSRNIIPQICVRKKNDRKTNWKQIKMMLLWAQNICNAESRLKQSVSKYLFP